MNVSLCSIVLYHHKSSDVNISPCMCLLIYIIPLCSSQLMVCVEQHGVFKRFSGVFIHWEKSVSAGVRFHSIPLTLITTPNTETQLANKAHIQREKTQGHWSPHQQPLNTPPKHCVLDGIELLHTLCFLLLSETELGTLTLHEPSIISQWIYLVFSFLTRLL